MKRMAVLLSLVLLASAGTASAEIYFNLQGTYAKPTDAPYASGPGFGIAAGWSWDSRFSIELGLRNWGVPVEGTDDGLSLGKLCVLPLELSFRGRLPLGPKFNLYGDAGAGLAIYSFTLDEDLIADWDDVGFAITETVKNNLAFHLGVGVEYILSPKLAIDFGCRWHLLRTKGEWSIADSFSGETASGTIENLNFDALTLSLGLKISIFGSGEIGI